MSALSEELVQRALLLSPGNDRHDPVPRPQLAAEGSQSLIARKPNFRMRKFLAWRVKTKQSEWRVCFVWCAVAYPTLSLAFRHNGG